MTLRLVVVSLEAWDDMWRRNQYLVDGLLRSDPSLEVLFVEPPTDPLYAMRSGEIARRGAGLRTVDDYDGRLRLYQSTKVFPRRAGTWVDGRLAHDIRRVVNRLGWTNGVLWVNDPGSAAVIDALGWPCLYDMTDDWVAADRGSRDHDRIAAGDAELLRRSDEVIVCSTGLQNTKGSVRPVRLIPNAVEVRRYRTPQDRPADLPDRPVALYVGTLHEDRLDVDLVLATADRVAEAGGVVVLVGPDLLTAENDARLSAHAAVDILGLRVRDAVPGYLQHVHVLIVPHVVNDFTESLDPIKLYEYLAVGRPVVSTRVAGFRDEPVVVAPDREHFPESVANALAEWAPTVDRGAIADWSERVDAFRTVLSELEGDA
ncbi:glycosyltransferase [Humibacter sp. RRB41]|uniref:glycosyltransferase n=1 Tax=Humibacter sp. RRB41 TaxID=2919946 RepID=UPI001FA9DB7D|nr:glycosyltransferase [Humibacter sp. RRB41]